MTIKPDKAEPCWEPFDNATGQGYWHDEDRWPHYESRAKCDESIVELLRDHDSGDGPFRVIARQCFDRPCVVIVCDGCGEHFDYEGDGGMHFDPAEPMPVPITDCEWTIVERPGVELHYCPDCTPSACDDCGERHDEGKCPDAPLWRPVPVIEGQEVIPW